MMLVFTQIGHFETDREIDEHLSGFVYVINRPPQNLECPGYVDDIDIFLIDYTYEDTDLIDNSSAFISWDKSIAHWDDHKWSVEIQHAEKTELGIKYLLHISRLNS